MRIDIVTIFPRMFESILKESIIKRAQNNGKVQIYIHNLRDYSRDKHRKIDDRPFGGGTGMVMRPEPIFKAIETLKPKTNPSTTLRIDGERPSTPLEDALSERSESNGRSRTTKNQKPKTKIILLCPQGEKLTQRLAKRLSRYKHLILICGHYEGIDERVRQYLVDEEISIGDYILTGGELPAMVLVDSLVRLIPGVLGDKNSLKFESFEDNLLEYPQYTRPSDFRGMKVPQILLCGNHKKIEQWRKIQALKITKSKRPDLILDKK